MGGAGATLHFSSDYSKQCLFPKALAAVLKKYNSVGFFKKKFFGISTMNKYCSSVGSRNLVTGEGFFADPDPDPGFKSPDPDPSINKLMGSKLWF